MFLFLFEDALLKIWGPIFTNLEKLAAPCARGYVKLLLKLLEDGDLSLKRNDLVCFGVLLKNSVNVFDQLLPYIQHKRTQDVIRQIVDATARHLAQSSNRNVDLNKLNEFSIRFSNDLNESVNAYLGKN